MISKRFLRFRLQQIRKFIKDIPLPYLCLLLLLAGTGIYSCYKWMAETEGALWVTFLLLTAILYFHLYRKDFHFISLIEEKAGSVFFTDYLLLSFPFTGLALLQGQWIASLLLIGGCMGISLIRQPYRKRLRGVPVPSWIPFRAFELRSGWRKYGIGLLFCYLSAFIALWIPYLSLILLWLLTGFYSIFFSPFEPVSILTSENLATGTFLSRKIKLNLFLFGLLILPVCLFYILLRPEQWWMVLYFFIAVLLNISLFILTKYAFYTPDKKLINGQMAIGFSYIGILIPVFAPFTLLFLFRYYRMAYKQLTPYLYVNN